MRIRSALLWTIGGALFSAIFAGVGLTLPVSPANADASMAVCAGLSPTSATQASLAVGGVPRTYLVHVPPLAAGRRVPLIFAFHGRGETPESFATYSGLSRLSAVLVYPRGLPGRGGKLSWSGTPTAAPAADDVGFTRALLARFVSAPCVDRTRVYATGKSDGGGFAARLACVAADRFAAVAPVAGAYYPIAGGCRPTRAVAMLEIHGTADRVVPYTGSRRRHLPAIADWLAAWRERDGCRVVHPARRIADGVTQTRADGCRDGATVEGDRIRGGGHTWPGARAPSGPGATSRAIDATTAIAAFFSAHALAGEWFESVARGERTVIRIVRASSAAGARLPTGSR